MSRRAGLGLVLAVLIACTLALARPATAAEPLSHRQTSTATYQGTHAAHKASTTTANTITTAAAATEIGAQHATTVAADKVASDDADEVTRLLVCRHLSHVPSVPIVCLISMHECECARAFRASTACTEEAQPCVVINTLTSLLDTTGHLCTQPWDQDDQNRCCRGCQRSACTQPRKLT